jgi:hypothetical protein
LSAQSRSETKTGGLFQQWTKLLLVAFFRFGALPFAELVKGASSANPREEKLPTGEWNSRVIKLASNPKCSGRSYRIEKQL